MIPAYCYDCGETGEPDINYAYSPLNNKEVEYFTCSDCGSERIIPVDEMERDEDFSVGALEQTMAMKSHGRER